MLDDGTSATGVYAVFNASNMPVRLLVINTDYYGGTDTRATSTVSLSGLSAPSGVKQAKRMTAPSATSTSGVTIGGSTSFTNTCMRSGSQATESVSVSGGTMSVSVSASEALIVFL